MSQQNIELVRESLEAFERGDLDRALANAHPDLVSTRVHPDGAVFHGPDGFRQLLADWLEGFSEASFWSGDYIDAGDRMIVHQHQRGRGAGSGALVEGTSGSSMRSPMARSSASTSTPTGTRHSRRRA